MRFKRILSKALAVVLASSMVFFDQSTLMAAEVYAQEHAQTAEDADDIGLVEPLEELSTPEDEAENANPQNDETSTENPSDHDGNALNGSDGQPGEPVESNPSDSSVLPEEPETSKEEENSETESSEKPAPIEEAKTYTWSNTQVEVIAALEPGATIPEGSVLVVTPVTPGSSLYQESVEKVEQEHKGTRFEEHLVYDIAFELNGTKVEPEGGMVKVTLKYKKSVLKQADAKDLIVSHIDENDQIENLDPASRTNAAGEVNQVSFTTESFSTFVLSALQQKSGEIVDFVAGPNSNPVAEVTVDDVTFTFTGDWNFMGIGSSGGWSIRVTEDPELTDQPIGHGAVLNGKQYTFELFKNGQPASLKHAEPLKVLVNDPSMPDKDNLIVSKTDVSNNSVDPVDFNVEDEFTNGSANATIDGVNEIGTIITGQWSMSPDTFISNGGQYTIEYLFGNYQAVSFKDYKGNHFKGPCLVAGDLEASIGGISDKKFKPYPWTVPAYAGYLKTANKQAITYSDVAFYLGTKQFESDSNSMTLVGPDDTKYYKYLFAQNYLDVDAFQAAMTTLADSKTGTVQTVSGTKHTVDIGGSYEFSAADFSKLEELRFNGNFQSKEPTYIIIKDRGEVHIPRITVDPKSNPGITNNDGEVLSIETGAATSVVYLFPNATSVVFDKGESGHILAPNATVTGSGGYYNGGIIAFDIDVRNAEGHMWPFGAEIEVPETTSRSVTKVWNDGNKTPHIPVAVTLMNGTTPVGNAVLLHDQNQWQAVWPDLPLKDGAGNVINYTIQETPVAGYVSTVERVDAEGNVIAADNTETPVAGFKLTNTESVEINGAKIWDDQNNAEKKRPESITISLYKGEKNSKTLVQENLSVTPDADGNWKWSFGSLPKYDADGKEIHYFIEETPVPDGYTAEYSTDGLSVTNKRERVMVEVKVTKKWDDNANQDGVRPDITLNLLADGETVKTWTVTGKGTTNDEVSFTFPDLPKYNDEGKEIEYTATEEMVGVPYTSEITNTTAYDIVVTNKHTPAETTRSVQKIWNDADDQDGKRPDSIAVVLKGSDDREYPAVLTAEENWFYVWEHLPAKANGHDITYTVVEPNVPDGYTSQVNLLVTKNFEIVNTYAPEKTSRKVVKTWEDDNNQDGVRPDELKVVLKATGQADRAAVLSAANNWAYEWTDLPKNENGQEIKYTIEEDLTGDAYELVSSTYDPETSTFSLINKHESATESVSGNKIWNDSDNRDGIRPTSITVTLNKQVGDQGEVTPVKSKSVVSPWTFSFDNLPSYENGQKITYSITEDSVPTGYVSEINGTTITNTHEIERISVSGKKTWVNPTGQGGIPDELTVHLLADGVQIAEKTVTAVNGWSYTFDNLEKYRADRQGVEIQYSIGEVSIPGWTGVISGNNITNTYNPTYVSKTVRKIWTDHNNQDGKRPASIKVNLLADGVVKQTVEINQANNWTYTWPKLDEKNDGKVIKYSITEDKIDDYETKIIENADGWSIQNGYTPEKIHITGKKTWDDNNNQDGIRPEKINVNLYADNVLIQTQEVTAKNDWTYAFMNLPKYKAGQIINYEIRETEVKGYTSSLINDNDLVNTHVPAVTEKSITKQWDDENDIEGFRPDSVEVSLLANGKELQKATLNAENNWTATWSNLPVYENGKKIEYNVEEADVPEYTSSLSKDGTVLTNTHIVQLTSIVGKKTWNDNDDQDGIRPDQITVILNKKAGSQTTEVRRQTVKDPWTYSFENLPAYENGKLIEYSIQEVEVDGYTTRVDGFDLINTHEIGKVQKSITKVWNDGNNVDGKRPASIEVSLFADGEFKEMKQLDASNNWTYTWEDLDAKKDGHEIVYTVQESEVPGYTASWNDDRTIVTNTHIPEVTQISGEKIWDDKNNQDGKRPESITVILNKTVNGKTEKADEMTVKAPWKYSFTEQPVYENGEKIIYTIEETTVDGYTTKVDGYNLTNTHVPETTEVKGTKTWVDDNDRDGLRPANITVILNKTVNGKTKKVAEQTVPDPWTYTFLNLPVYENGKKIEYSITEAPVTGYSSTSNGFNLTNAHELETISVSGKKTWVDPSGKGTIPESIQINLRADDEVVQTKKVTASDNWSYTFENLPKNREGKHNVPIVYSVAEVKVDGWTRETNGYNITNTYNPGAVNKTVQKVWVDHNNQDNKRPASITVILKADGKEVDRQVITAAQNWQYTWFDLPERQDGRTIAYTLEELPVKGYESLISEKADGWSIRNSYTPEEIEINGTKTWFDSNNQDGIRPKNITVNLYKNGVLYKTQTVTEASNWEYSFTGLPKFEAGQEIKYTISEDAVDGYTTKVDGYNLTNTHEPEAVEKTIYKVWNEANNVDGKRPASIEVSLFANGEFKETVTLSAANNWMYSWKDLPANKDGKPIAYTIQEVNVPDGYTSSLSEDGNTLTNTHIPEVTTMEGAKIWDDANNQDGIRPENIKVILNKTVDGKTTKADEQTISDPWTYRFENLPVYENGKKIVYSIAEEKVDGYTTKVDGNNLINTHAIKTVEVSGKKTWNNTHNQGKIPESIQVSLLANGFKVDSKTVSAEDDWSYTFNNLPKYEEGKVGEVITYTITEEEVEGWSVDVNGYDLTNTYTPGFVNKTVEKVWVDADNQDGMRPASIQVTLKANGEAIDTVVLNEANHWTKTWEGLDEKENGEFIEYSVEEAPVDGYTTDVIKNDNGWTITNTHSVVLSTFTGAKTWMDENNLANTRPASITVRLFANGEQIMEQTVDASTNWTWQLTDLPAYKDGKKIEYTLREDPVDGYVGAVDGFNVTNTVTSVSISKVDIANGKELEGATIQILDKDGNVVEEWISTSEAHEVKGLKTNETHTLKEIVAPDGYEITSETTFTLKEDGTIDSEKTTTTTDKNGTLLVEDEMTSVSISKVDIASGEELEGATIQILDKDGNVVEEWVSTGKAHEVKGLKTNETYTLKETVAPDGYEVTTETTFTLKEDGTIDSENTTTTTDENGTLLVEDKMTSVSISKVDIANGEELEGATIQILDKDGKVVEEWVSTKEAHEVKGLKTNETYTLKETVAPDGYAVTVETTFTLKEDGTIDSNRTTTNVDENGTLLVEDKMTSVSISKVDIANGEELEGATIQILDKDGNVVEEWISTKEAHVVQGLKTNETYTLKETVAPDGYAVTTETTFTLKADGTIDSENTTTTADETGGLLVEDRMTSVSISKVDIANGKELEDAKMQILDRNGKVVKEWTSSKQPEIITGLNVLETYTLREIVAPNGYQLCADTSFELNADGSINTEKTTTKISKEGILLVEDAAIPNRKPQNHAPNTGAGSGLVLYSCLFTTSSASLLALLKKRKKHQK